MDNCKIDGNFGLVLTDKEEKLIGAGIVVGFIVGFLFGILVGVRF